MTDKQALREAAEKALPAMKRLLMMPNDELFDEALLNVDGDVDAANAFNLLTGPETVLALLDELEAKDRRIEEEIGRANREHHRGFMMACGHLKEHANAHYADAAEMEIEALRKRIAELESRTVTLEPFRSFVTDADIAALHRFAECCDDPESGGHDLEKEQVRRLEAIGALQRSGRISYITDFGDVLISITAGIGKGE